MRKVFILLLVLTGVDARAQASGSQAQESPSPARVTTTPAVADTIHATIKRIEFGKEPGRSGSRGDFVFFDIDWRLPASLAGRRKIDGVVVLSDGAGRKRVALPWPLESPKRLGRVFEERGIGWEAAQLGAAYEWLRATDPQEVSISYRVAASD